MSDPKSTMSRKTFLTKSAALLAGGAASASSSLSYSRIAGSNDRISLCHIGNGSRGSDLDLIASQLKTSHNVEMTTVCDLWSLNREKAVATNAKYYGRAPAPISIRRRNPRAKRCGRSPDLHARTLPLAAAENGRRRRQRRLRRKAHGQRTRRGQSRPRRRHYKQTHRPSRHAASQRTLSA